jgi:hypothetical protein
MFGQHKTEHGAFRVGGARNAKGVRWHDSPSNRRVLPFFHLFLLSVRYVHRDDDIQTEIYGRVLQTGSVGAETAVCGSSNCRRRGRGGGNGDGCDGSDSRSRFEETVRAYRGLLTTKIQQGLMVSRLGFSNWWTGRRV